MSVFDKFKDVDNQWDFGLFSKDDDVRINGIHYNTNSQIAYYRDDYTTDNYNSKDTFKNELNRYYQENCYNSYE